MAVAGVLSHFQHAGMISRQTERQAMQPCCSVPCGATQEADTVQLLNGCTGRGSDVSTQHAGMN